MSATNPWERAARLEKADALVLSCRFASVSADVLATANDEARATLVAIAQHAFGLKHPPSADTWSLVESKLREIERTDGAADSKWLDAGVA